jgi:hypothetical protein
VFNVEQIEGFAGDLLREARTQDDALRKPRRPSRHSRPISAIVATVLTTSFLRIEAFRDSG